MGPTEHSITESMQLADYLSNCQQPSILGPLFFCCNFSLVISPEITIALYADDCKTSWFIDDP